MLEKELSEWLAKQFRLYIPLTDEDATAMAMLFSCRKIPKRELLLKEGHYGDWWGFVYKGLLRAYSFDAKCNECTSGFFKEGAFTCELVSFNGAARSPTSVEALEETFLLCVNRQVLEALFKRFAVFERFGRLLYEETFSKYKQHSLFRVRFNARERYLHFLKNEPDLVNRVPLKYVASYLSVTDTSLSRIRRNIT